MIFLAGLFFGALLGFFGCALCTAAKRGDAGFEEQLHGRREL